MGYWQLGLQVQAAGGILHKMREGKDMAKILIVEDNDDYRELLQNFLENKGYSVETANDGTQALESVEKDAYDLILLDLMLPKIGGYEVCERIRRTQDVPIIMLTALGSEEHQMRGYEMQIDGYITKPISMPLLMQKVEAVLRRTMKLEEQTLSYGEILLNPNMHIVTAAGIPVGLTPREFEILQELMQKPGEVVTRKSLVDKFWGYDGYGETRIVDTHIKNIRRKLAEHGCIDTVRGVGYRLAAGNIKL